MSEQRVASALEDSIQMDIMNLKESIYFIAIQPFTRLIYLKSISNHNANTLIPIIKNCADQYAAKRIICDQEFDKDVYRDAIRNVKILCVKSVYEQHTKLAHINRACRTVRDVYNSYYTKSMLRGDNLAQALMDHVNNKLKNRYFNKPNSQVTFDENLALYQARMRRYFAMRFKPGDRVYVKYIKIDKFEKAQPIWCKRPYRIIGIEDKMYALVPSDNPMGVVIFRDDTQVRASLPERYDAVTYDGNLESTNWRYAVRIIAQSGSNNFWLELPDGTRQEVPRSAFSRAKGTSALEEQFTTGVENIRPKIYSIA